MGFRQSAARLPDAWNRLRADQRRQKDASDRIRSQADSLSALDPVASADVAGLRYVDDTSTAGIRRVGRGHRYLDPRGHAVSSRQVVQRIKALAIPPAWRDVWICPDPLGHLQATGRDARGRKQYRYHPRWRDLRDEVKYGRLLAFAKALPRIHDRTSADLRRTGLPREKVLAAVVQLLEKTLIRIGNDEYARHNHSYGLTTLLDRHAKVTPEGVRFEFRGKSGIAHAVDLRDARLARVVRKCQDLPGHTLFQYIDHDGHRQTIDSADVNAYLREISGDTLYGQGLSHLGRNGAGGAGTLCACRVSFAARSEEPRAPRCRIRGETPGQYASGVPEELHSSSRARGVHGRRNPRANCPRAFGSIGARPRADRVRGRPGHPAAASVEAGLTLRAVPVGLVAL